jgi:hypothetical protein
MEWLTYLLKVSACLGLFYALYHFFFQKLTFFSLNRFYLLSTLALSFIIPALNLQLKSDEINPPATRNYPRELVTVTARHTPIIQSIASMPARSVVGTPDLNWTGMLNTIYWCTAIIILSGMLIQIIILLWHSRKVVEVAGPLKIVQKTGRLTNCSFLHYIFIDQQELDKETLEAIMHHESVHAAQYHSADKILVGVCKALLWFSPPVYFYGRALEQAHEYEADKETSSLMGNTIYANLLLKLAVSTRHAPLVHSFVKNPVKERIKMLFTNQSKNMKKLTYLTLLPAGLALLWLFGIQIVYAESKASFVNPFRVQQPATALPAVPTAAKVAERKDQLNRKQQLPETIADPESPVRLVDNVILGDDPLVIIDGKKYTAEILNRISPACVKMIRFSADKADITTINSRIEYATKSEVETAKIRKRMKAQGKFYNRYRVTINGRKYDEIMVKMANSFSEAPFQVGYRIALFIDGKLITEKEAFKLPGNYAYDKTSIEYGYTDDDKDLFSKYGDKYDLVMQFTSKADTSEQKAKVKRGAVSNISADYYGRFEYSAKDSTAYSKDKRYVTLFGDAQIHNEHWVIKADKIKFDSKTRTLTAQNVNFTFKDKKTPVEAAFVKIDVDKGTYEVLSGTPDF